MKTFIVDRVCVCRAIHFLRAKQWQFAAVQYKSIQMVLLLESFVSRAREVFLL